jgi:hypothetical protein
MTGSAIHFAISFIAAKIEPSRDRVWASMYSLGQTMVQKVCANLA